MQQLGVEVDKIDPDKFLSNKPDATYQYINLASNMTMRRQINDYFDQHLVDRFSLVVDDAYINADSIGPGVFVYPHTTIYPSARIEADSIIHCNNSIAHGVFLGRNCFTSGDVSIAGSTQVGKNCYFGTSATVIDKINIADNVIITTGSLVTKDIDEPNTTFVLRKLIKSQHDN